MFASINRPGWRDGAASTGKAMRWIAVLPAMVLVACATEKDDGAEAEKRYEMVKRVGTKGEACEESRKVADAYLQAGDEREYELWHARSGIDCLNAELTSPGLPASEDEAYRKAKAEAEAAAQQIRDAANEAVEGLPDE